MASRKVAFVTGAHTGLGCEIVKALLHSPEPYHVILGSLSLENGQEAARALEKERQISNTVQVIQIDVTCDESIENAYQAIKESHGALDVLVNNAGASFDHMFTEGKMSLRESFTKAYGINVAGNNAVTAAFMPLLLRSADPRLIFITGMSHMTRAAEAYFPTPPLPAGWPKEISWETIGYRCSKTALNMLMLDWNHKLKADGVRVWSINPGLLATNLGGLTEEIIAQRKGNHPRVGAQLVLDVVEGKRDADVGRIVEIDGLTPF